MEGAEEIQYLEANDYCLKTIKELQVKVKGGKVKDINWIYDYLYLPKLLIESRA